MKGRLGRFSDSSTVSEVEVAWSAASALDSQETVVDVNVNIVDLMKSVAAVELVALN